MPSSLDACHAEYYKNLHECEGGIEKLVPTSSIGITRLASPIIMLLTCSIPVISMYFLWEWKTVDPEQMASSEAS